MVQIIQSGPSTATLRQAALNDALSSTINSWGEMQKTQRQQALEYADAINKAKMQNPNANLTDQEAAHIAGLDDQYAKKIQSANQPGMFDNITGAISRIFSSPKAIPEPQDSQPQIAQAPTQLSSQDANAQGMAGDSRVAKSSIVALPNDQQTSQGSISKIIQTSTGPIDLNQYSSADQKIILARQASNQASAAQQKIKNDLDKSVTDKNLADAEKTYQEKLQMIKDSGLTSQEKMARIAELKTSNSKHMAEIAMMPTEQNLKQSMTVKNYADAEKMKQEVGAQGKLAKLSGETQGKVGGIASALKAINGIELAMNKGIKPEFVDSNTPMLGMFKSDNELTSNQRILDEVVGRLESGGAIGKDEAKGFRSMGPRPGDNSKIQQQKLADQKTFLKNKLNAYGLNLDDLRQLNFDIGESSNALARSGNITNSANASSIRADQHPNANKAIEWANNNQNDPRAKQILQRLGR